MKHPGEILSETRRVLRPGGEVLIVDFPKDSLAQELWNEDYYTPEDVQQMVSDSGFEDVHAKRIEQGQVMWITGRRTPHFTETT
jgi:ubiquinone/menaquinone biosynthesis C-methylase UbiE